MTTELELGLVAEFPGVFRDYGGDMTETCMHWGFAHDDGWFTLLRTYCLRVEAIRKASGVSAIASQVKEKWGRLEFYQDLVAPDGMGKEERDVWFGILDALEEQLCDDSLRTCEVCGKPGRLRYRGVWQKTVCSADAAALGFTDQE